METLGGKGAKEPEGAEGLKRRGVRAWSAKEAENLGFTDEEELEYATRENSEWSGA